MTIRTAWLPPTGQTRADTRLALSALTTPGNALAVNHGCTPGGLTLTGLTGADGMKCRIGTGRAVVQGLSEQGSYPVAVTSGETLEFEPGDPTMDRIDLIVLQVYDADYDNSGRTDAVLRVIKGAPAAAPVAPATPGCALALYRVLVKANASVANGGIAWAVDGVKVDVRHYTAALGGILPPRDPAFSGVYAGQYRDNGGRLERWDGTAWRPNPGAVGLPSAPGVYAGQYRDTGDRMERWDGSAWRPYPIPTALAYTADAGYTTGVTTFVEYLADTPTNSTLAVTFLAPPSGRVAVSVGARFDLLGTTATTFAEMSATVRQGSTVASAPADETVATVLSTVSPTRVSASTTFVVTGLTKYSTYTATTCYRISEATGRAWFDNRYVRVDPL
ncbi:hypothetical protein F4556_004065 [Kitasatospora gansuensis]|uniref:Uncharacterized protein n=1 Tax=Kitasatospora gansuensis TaxID=258050 RepID=A0A7W7SDN8_9ACTN|nr:hypothetical protein [Kitasatospora gansuensis]MBB4948530.1 hypothetical protein [Kitasatospora gansuensis]